MNRYRLSKAGIDVNDGLRRFNNNKEMYEKFLLTFPDDEYFGKMKTAIDDNNVEAAFQAAHALKGISGTLSLVNLHANLIPLVEELRAGSMVKVPDLLPPVEDSYKLAYDEVVREVENAKQ